MHREGERYPANNSMSHYYHSTCAWLDCYRQVTDGLCHKAFYSMCLITLAQRFISAAKKYKNNFIRKKTFQNMDLNFNVNFETSLKILTFFVTLIKIKNLCAS